MITNTTQYNTKFNTVEKQRNSKQFGVKYH